MAKTGRNDPCPCGSGKKYKQCCLKNEPVPGAPKKFKASWLSGPKSVDLMQRTFGAAINPPMKESSEETEKSS